MSDQFPCPPEHMALSLLALKIENDNLYRAIEDIGVRNEELKAENEELRRELAQWERLADGIELPEYPIVTFQPREE